jgi:formylglycine-generating enzyme required for sulfatase activity
MHIRGTTPVGVFPTGNTPEGLADMMGNTWDWTGSLYRNYPYQDDDGREDANDGASLRVVRGGSWYYGSGHARASFRVSFRPGARNSNVGVRLVCASPMDR